MSFANTFLRSEFTQRSSWKWWSALLTAIAIYALATGVSVAIYVFLTLPATLEPGVGVEPGSDSDRLATAVLIAAGQVLVIIGVIVMAGWKNSGWGDSLYLHRAAISRPWIIVFISLAAALLVIVASWEYVFQEVLAAEAEDTNQMLLAPETRLATLAILTIGAPISEEFLFRGFILPPLAMTRLGFWGAAFVTNTIWTVIHFYSWQGSVEVFFIGLCLSYLVWRTGSLRPAILLHSLANLSFAIIVLAS